MIEDNKPTQKLVESWLALVSGEFHYTKACDDVFDKQYYPSLRMIFQRAKNKGLVEPVGSRDGWWRVVTQLPEPITFDDEPVSTDLVLPFELRKYVEVPKETVTLVCGAKSSGKSGFLCRTAYLNKDKKVIILNNLEGGRGILRDRMFAMGLTLPFPFRIYHVTENYHDHIHEENSIYIIDYIDAPDGESFYKIGHYVKRVSDKLQGLNSVAVVGLQKPENRDLPFGKDQTLKAAFLTIVLNKNILKIYDAKKSTDKTVNPNNMQWKFKYDEEGTKFTDIQQWFGL